MLEIALDCIRKGWHVFPCWPKTKKPMTKRGFLDASVVAEQVREWWAKTPDANVGIATGASRLVVLDIDNGINGVDDLRLYSAINGLPDTYSVKTGRRPGYGVQLYFAANGLGVRSIPWIDPETPGISGDIRGASGYVMAAGCVHPSGERYQLVREHDIAGVPAFVRELQPVKVEVSEDAPITSNRNNSLTSIAGKLRNAGLSASALEVALL